MPQHPGKQEHTILTPSYYYDVAISFANNDRWIASKLAKLLNDKGIVVFFEDWNPPTPGKALHEYFNKIRKSSRFCILLISEAYIEGSLTRFELRTTAAEAISNPSYDILPVKVDDSSMPTEIENIKFLDLKSNSIEEIASRLSEIIKARQNTIKRSYNVKNYIAHHVIPRERGVAGWSVKRSGSSKATRVMRTKKAAISYAKSISKSLPHREIIIHKKDGSISERITSKKGSAKRIKNGS